MGDYQSSGSRKFALVLIRKGWNRWQTKITLFTFPYRLTPYRLQIRCGGDSIWEELYFYFKEDEPPKTTVDRPSFTKLPLEFLYRHTYTYAYTYTYTQAASTHLVYVTRENCRYLLQSAFPGEEEAESVCALSCCFHIHPPTPPPVFLPWPPCQLEVLWPPFGGGVLLGEALFTPRSAL